MKRKIRSFVPFIIWFNKGSWGINILKITFTYKDIYNSKTFCNSLFGFSYIKHVSSRSLNFMILTKEFNWSINKKNQTKEEIEWLY